MSDRAPAVRVADYKFWLAVAVAALSIGFVGVRAIGYRLFERGGLVTPANGPETPATFGAPFTRLTVRSGDRRLDAVAVDAPPAGAPVIVLAHGTAEAVSFWADAQALWRNRGVASFVFDYSGFGSSTGRASAAHCTEDVVAAYAAARAHFGAGRRYVLVGYSLGTGPWLQTLPTLEPRPDAIALVAGYSSARAGAVAFLKVKPWLTLLMPDLWNNVSAVRRASVPVLVVHSDADSLFPMAMAESVAVAAGPRGRLVRIKGFSHPEGHRNPTAPYWDPVLAFVRGDAPMAMSR